MKKIFTLALTALTALTAFADPIKLTVKADRSSSISNGITRIEILSNGRANVLRYNKRPNMLNDNGIYFDYTADANKGLSPDKVEIIKQTDDYVEILYSNTTSKPYMAQGWIMRSGDPGVYTYIIMKGNAGSENVSIRESRVCTRTSNYFLTGYVDDSMNGPIPSCSEMATAEGNEIQDATYRLSDGTIYTKYDWANYVVNDSVHGLMWNKDGIWNIAASHEWLNGGPMRQELTVHATSKSPISIQMLQGEHFGGKAMTLREGEIKLYGPIYIYPNGGTHEEMIADAKAVAAQKAAEWPYEWFENEYYPLDRSTVSGKISIINGHSRKGIQVVLCEPGSDPYLQNGKYIFWGKTDEWGRFSIPKVRKGTYALYAYATEGDNTDVLQKEGIVVDAETVDLGEISWTPKKYETTYFSIGENNRRSDGFKFSDAPRAYGHWADVPATLTYTWGESSPAEDWYFAQCKNGTWTVRFNADAAGEGDLHLTASIAGATNSPSVKVKVNGKQYASWSFYNDAGIYRSARQGGRHCIREAVIPASALTAGENTLELTMSGVGKNGGVMWDCIKLEGGNPVYEAAGVEDIAADASAADYEIYTVSGVKVAVVPSLDALKLPAGLYIYRNGARSGKIRLR